MIQNLKFFIASLPFLQTVFGKFHHNDILTSSGDDCLKIKLDTNESPSNQDYAAVFSSAKDQNVSCEEALPGDAKNLDTHPQAISLNEQKINCFHYEQNAQIKITTNIVEDYSCIENYPHGCLDVQYIITNDCEDEDFQDAIDFHEDGQQEENAKQEEADDFQEPTEHPPYNEENVHIHPWELLLFNDALRNIDSFRLAQQRLGIHNSRYGPNLNQSLRNQQAIRANIAYDGNEVMYLPPAMGPVAAAVLRCFQDVQDYLNGQGDTHDRDTYMRNMLNDRRYQQDNIVVSVEFSRSIKFIALFLAINTIVLAKLVFWESMLWMLL